MGPAAFEGSPLYQVSLSLCPGVSVSYAGIAKSPRAPAQERSRNKQELARLPRARRRRLGPRMRMSHRRHISDP